jgi:pyruvate,orthophosphate dikinase
MRSDVLSGKGAGLVEMASLGLPVPPGFVIGADVSIEFMLEKRISNEVRSEVDTCLNRLEKLTEDRLGDPVCPLLLSVRSGARVSMPGMMDTILNLGINDAVVDGLTALTGDRRFALDTFRRFISMHASTALGISKGQFDRELEEARLLIEASGGDARHLSVNELMGPLPHIELNVVELERLVTTFKMLVTNAIGREFPSDPREQLWQAIEAVFRSWNSPRAATYRRLFNIPDDWGTACIIQAMVFGNLGETSGSGVAFTRNPSTGERVLYGEWIRMAQGEDVVGGTCTPLPLRSSETPLARPDESLQAKMPDVYRALESIAKVLERHYRDMQDLEFTIQKGAIYVLQCRPAKRTARAAAHAAVDMVKEGLISKEEAVQRVDLGAIEQLLGPTVDPASPSPVVATGLAASPGVASGPIVFHPDEAQRRAERGDAPILVRVETSVDDIQGMQAARAVLTARGGITSHAAVIARSLGKPCVVGVRAIAVNFDTQTMTICLYDDAGHPTGTISLKKGDVVTVDGTVGCVYLGELPTVKSQASSELDQLRTWADALRSQKLLHGDLDKSTAADSSTSAKGGSAS